MTTVQHRSFETIKQIADSLGTTPLDAMLMLQYMHRNSSKELSSMAMKAKLTYSDQLNEERKEWEHFIVSGKDRIERLRSDVESFKRDIWAKCKALERRLDRGWIYWQWQIPKEYQYLFSNYRSQMAMGITGLRMPAAIFVALDYQIDEIENKLRMLEREVRFTKEFLMQKEPHDHDGGQIII